MNTRTLFCKKLPNLTFCLNYMYCQMLRKEQFDQRKCLHTNYLTCRSQTSAVHQQPCRQLKITLFGGGCISTHCSRTLYLRKLMLCMKKLKKSQKLNTNKETQSTLFIFLSQRHRNGRLCSGVTNEAMGHFGVSNATGQKAGGEVPGQSCAQLGTSSDHHMTNSPWSGSCSLFGHLFWNFLKGESGHLFSTGGRTSYSHQDLRPWGDNEDRRLL